jgi:hypothetical protein
METLYKNSETKSETGCCPRFDPKPWKDKRVTWKSKLFVKDKVASFLHIPLNFGQVMVRNMERIQKAGATTKTPLMLSDETSLWGSDVYIAVAKKVGGAENVAISGTFLTKVFEGSYKDMGKWIAEMNRFVGSKGKKAKKLYFFYTTCPACAKYYGKNYVVILAQI